MTKAAAPGRSAQGARGRRAAPQSPLDELRVDGRVGPEGAALLYRVARAVAVGRGFPPPSGRGAWDSGAVTEVAHDFLADGRTPTRLAHLLVHAVDDDSFERILHRMVLNFLRDGGRRTDIGRLMLRLRDVMGRNDQFVAEGGDCWRLASEPPTPSSATPAVLTHAAAAEPHVDVPRWGPQTRRRAPAADAASIVRLCQRVLEAAGGTVTLDQLATSIAPRLGLSPQPLAHVLDGLDPIDVAAAPSGDVLDGMRAAEILATLRERERLVLAAAGTPVRELRSVIGLGPSQAAEVQKRLRALLAVELQGDDNYESVFFHLVDQAKAWARARPGGQQEAVQRLMNAT